MDGLNMITLGLIIIEAGLSGALWAILSLIW